MIVMIVIVSMVVVFILMLIILVVVLYFSVPCFTLANATDGTDEPGECPDLVIRQAGKCGRETVMAV